MWKAVVFIKLLVWSSIGSNRCSINDLITNREVVIYDLSHVFDEDTIYWPTAKQFEYTKKTAEYTENGWFAANDFAAGEHGGTHMDAPYHFYREGKFLGDLTLDRLILPLLIIDISAYVNGNPNFVLYKRHLDLGLLRRYNRPCMVIFKFGWTRFYGDRDKYLGRNATDGSLNFPGLSQEVAEWITANENVLGVGMDTASLDAGSSTTSPAHKVLLTAGLFGIENVKLDVPVPALGCTGLALPMKLASGTGGPLRLAALCPRPRPAPALCARNRDAGGRWSFKYL